MNPFIIAQELARKNNENAAVYAAYMRRRQKRQGLKRRPSRGKLSKRLDNLDRQAAEHEARPVRAVGFFLP